MRVTLTTFFVLFLFSFSFAQVPRIKWSKYITSFPSSEAGVFDVKTTRDNGFIVVGFDSASNYYKNSLINKWARGKPMIAKLDSVGNVIWYRYQNVSSFGENDGCFLSVQQTVDRGYVATGYTAQLALSNSGGDPSNLAAQLFVGRYNTNGTAQWEKTYGGASPGGGDDRAMSIQEVNGNGFIVAGFTDSNDGDVIGNHSFYFDAWLLRLDVSGNILWKKCYGGTGSDSAYAILQTPDKGFIVAGSSTSNNGDLNSNFGASDAWVFKVDSLGTLLWQKNYGGNGDEAFKSVTLNSDGTYTFVGYSSSTNISGATNSGKNDLWAVKTTLDGQIIWSKLLGGSADEQGFSVASTPDGNNLISGYTESNDGIVSGNQGGADAWLLKIDASGNLIWQKCIGTGSDDGALACTSVTESDYMITGFSMSSSSPFNVDQLGNANTIKGTLFKDDNLNGVKDVNESLFSIQALINIQKQGGYLHSTITQNGQFSIDIDTGTYISSPIINSPYYNIVPPSINSSFANYFNKDSISFAVQPIPNKKDLVINLVAISRPRPGSDSYLRIIYKNVGTTTISSGEILLAKDSRVHYNSSYPLVSSSVGDTLKWTYSNLAPGDSTSILLNESLDPPPSLNSGDTLKYLAIITPITADETPSNDTASLKLIVVNSLDPNDKTENNSGIIGSDYITQGKYLNYTIRFQNTGTDTAFNVIVRDTLDNKLDWSTFEMIAASHPNTVSITNQNKFKWAFANINLPDSNINGPLSHGYLSYRVKPKSTAVAGDVINNLASIYFDYNLPVATNNAITLVQDNFSVLPIQLINFNGQLNNNIAQLNWKTNNAINFKQFEIERSNDGKNFSRIETVAFDNLISDYHAHDNISLLPFQQIFYRLKLVDTDGKSSYSKVIVFNLSTASNFLVYPNPARTELFVSFNSNKNEFLGIKVIDASGKLISENQKEIQKGNNIFPINISKLKAGNYVLQIISKEQTRTSKFVIIQ